MTEHQRVAATLDAINQAWQQGRPRDLEPLFHPEIVVCFPGGRSVGRAAAVAGFEDFCAHARVHDFEASQQQVDLFDATAVASCSFKMVYERGGQRYACTGRDLWVLQREAAGWLAVWRMMSELAETPISVD